MTARPDTSALLNMAEMQELVSDSEVLELIGRFAQRLETSQSIDSSALDLTREVISKKLGEKIRQPQG